jgi:hypothetical protein
LRGSCSDGLQGHPRRTVPFGYDFEHTHAQLLGGSIPLYPKKPVAGACKVIFDAGPGHLVEVDSKDITK